MKSETNTANPVVMVVEDDRSVRQMLRLSLQAAGFEVTEAANGREALDLLKDGAMAAVVLDLGLPDGLGGVVLERLRRGQNGGAVTPVWVVVSALDREEATKRYGPLGSHFMAKPFNPWDLVRTLETLLGKE